MSALLVDWLGRGGIAQCTESWAIVLQEAGVPVTIVTRPDRELGRGTIPTEAPESHRNRVLSHRAIVRQGVTVIERDRPSTVVVQNYVLPLLEWPVYRAARDVGARLVLVVHDHQLHSRWAGSSTGLRRLLRAADEIVAHSAFVASSVAAMADRPVGRMPLPVPLGMTRLPAVQIPYTRSGGRPVALHFGILHRSYKGTATVMGVAARASDRWQVVAAGAGAPRAPGITTIDRFLDSAELVAAVRSAEVTLLPYRWATQSAAVLLAQALGSIPVASAVGGIDEQIRPGVTGVLLRPEASVDDWVEALDSLADEAVRAPMVAAAADAVAEGQAAFARAAVTTYLKGVGSTR